MQSGCSSAAAAATTTTTNTILSRYVEMNYNEGVYIH
jgi:hypothetical protein